MFCVGRAGKPRAREPRNELEGVRLGAGLGLLGRPRSGRVEAGGRPSEWHHRRKELRRQSRAQTPRGWWQREH